MLSSQNRNPRESTEALNECIPAVQMLKHEFHLFIEQCTGSSEMCRYWKVLQVGINYLQDLIAPDREGDWEGHLLAVQNLLPIFSINYLR